MTNPTPAMASQMANAVRMLAVDAFEKAKSGHPGAPMGMADIAEVLWNRHLPDQRRRGLLVRTTVGWREDVLSRCPTGCGNAV